MRFCEQCCVAGIPVARRSSHLSKAVHTSISTGRPECFMMSTDPIALHVSPTGENWEVEYSLGTIAQAETKEEAIEAAREAAPDHKAELIIIHTSDGMIEKEIPVQGRSHGVA